MFRMTMKTTALGTAMLVLPLTGFLAMPAMADGCMTYGMSPAMTASADVVETDGSTMVILANADDSDGLTLEDDGAIMAMTDVRPLDKAYGDDGVTAWTLADADMDAVFRPGEPPDFVNADFDGLTAPWSPDLTWTEDMLAALTEIDPAFWTANGLMDASSS